MHFVMVFFIYDEIIWSWIKVFFVVKGTRCLDVEAYVWKIISEIVQVR